MNKNDETKDSNYSLEQAIESFGELLTKKERFLVCSHINPDGDTIASAIAMAHLLEAHGKEFAIYDRDPVPYNYQFLKKSEEVHATVPFHPDVTILVDCGAPGRIGPEFPNIGWGDTIVVIDHHKSYDDKFADLYIRDQNASAAGEVVYRVIKRLGRVTLPIAEAIYCSILTDTNCFRYSSTNSETFRVASEMLEVGVQPWYMASNIYETQPVERVQLLAKVLETLTISSEGRLASLFVSRDLINEYGATDDFVDGFINYARGIQGVEIATQIMEEPDSVWRISFRSRGNVDCSVLAENFNGGGHKNSAGCRMHGTKEEVQARLSAALNKIIDDTATE